MRNRGSTSWTLLFLCCLAGTGCKDRPAEKPAVKEGPAEKPDRSGMALDKKQREFLWDVEHHGLTLTKYGFQALANALSSDDEQALFGLLAADFAGQVPRDPREVKLDADYAQVTRLTDTGKPPQELDRQGFVARLRSYRSAFTSPPKVKLALNALAPVLRDKLDGMWQGSAVLRMWGEMGEGQPGEVVLTIKYRVARPTQENLRGGWLHGCTITQSLTGHAPHFLMRNATAERGLPVEGLNDAWKSQHTVDSGVFVTDYDRDGYLDVLITDGPKNALYRGRPGGKFIDVTTQVGIPSHMVQPGFTTAGFADLDGDGWEDLLLNNRVYQNDHGKGFVDVTDRGNIREVYLESWIAPSPRKHGGTPTLITGVVVGDYDRDGKVDLYFTRSGPGKVSSWVEGKVGWHKGNVLLHNLGDWRFEDVTKESGADGGDRSVFSAAYADVNGDGWPDIYVPNEFGDGILLVNQGNGKFREQSLTPGPSDYGSMGVAAGDIDNDGNIDLYMANMYSKAGKRVIGNLLPDTYTLPIMETLRHFVEGSQLYLNHGGMKFQKVGQDFQVAAVGWAYGPTLSDLNNDGFLDLYATCGFSSRRPDEPDG